MSAMGLQITISLLKAEYEVKICNRTKGKARLVEEARGKVADLPCIANKQDTAYQEQN